MIGMKVFCRLGDVMKKYRLSNVIVTVAMIAVLATGCGCYDSYTLIDKPSVSSTHQDTSSQSTTIKNENTTTQEPTTEESTTMPPVHIPTEEELLMEIVQGMTLEEKVGQMFIARCPADKADKLAEEYHLGGYILFARDFEGKTKEQVVADIQSYQSVSDIGMFIGVDEEGGIVNRVSKYTEFRGEPFKSPQDLYASGGYELIKQDAIEKSELLESLGINLNFAPVADVSTDRTDFIYRRTLGLGASETSTYIRTVVNAMNSRNMGSVLKHFPGYGGNEDTHEGIAYDDRAYDTFVSSDFLPFEAGIDSGASMVMVAHNIVYCMDDKYPASLSIRVHEILRKDLGFDGVIITDELSMEGVKQFASDKDVAVLAVQAGNDLLCCTNFQEQIGAVIDAVKSGDVSEERIDESVMRILKLKHNLGIIE